MHLWWWYAFGTLLHALLSTSLPLYTGLNWLQEFLLYFSFMVLSWTCFSGFFFRNKRGILWLSLNSMREHYRNTLFYYWRIQKRKTFQDLLLLLTINNMRTNKIWLIWIFLIKYPCGIVLYFTLLYLIQFNTGGLLQLSTVGFTQICKCPEIEKSPGKLIIPLKCHELQEKESSEMNVFRS